MDTSSINAMLGKRVSTKYSSQIAANVNKEVLTQGSSTGSGGISRDKYTTKVVSKTVLTQAEKVAFRKSLSSNGKLRTKDNKTRRCGENIRSEEDVIYVMDQNKSKLHRIYR